MLLSPQVKGKHQAGGPALSRFPVRCAVLSRSLQPPDPSPAERMEPEEPRQLNEWTIPPLTGPWLVRRPPRFLRPTRPAAASSAPTPRGAAGHREEPLPALPTPLTGFSSPSIFPEGLLAFSSDIGEPGREDGTQKRRLGREEREAA